MVNNYYHYGLSFHKRVALNISISHRLFQGSSYFWVGGKWTDRYRIKWRIWYKYDNDTIVIHTHAPAPLIAHVDVMNKLSYLLICKGDWVSDFVGVWLNKELPIYIDEVIIFLWMPAKKYSKKYAVRYSMPRS